MGGQLKGSQHIGLYHQTLTQSALMILGGFYLTCK